MGPPATAPWSSLVRYLIANSPSAYLVAIPKKAAIHIQKRAPGPPTLIAVATPIIFPVPTVAARAVHKAAKLDTSPCPLSLVKISWKALGRRKTCKRPRRAVR